MKRRTILMILLLLILQLFASKPAELWQAHAAGRKKVLMVLWRGTTTTEQAFKKHLERMGVDAEYTVINGEQNRTKLGASLRAIKPEIYQDTYDVIYSYGTTVTSMVKQINHNHAPVVFNIVYDPVGAGLVESLNDTGGNITGVTNGVPVDAQLEIFRSLVPFKNMVLFFTARERNANLLAKDVLEWTRYSGVNLTSIRVAPDTNALDEALADIKSGKIPCDIVYAGADTYMSSCAYDIATALGKDIPLFGGTATFVKRGWLATYAAPLDEMGRSAAIKVKQVLDGTPASEIPVTLPRPSIIISKKVSERFGIIPPEGAIVKP